MQRDQAYLLDILQAAVRAVSYCAGKSEEEFVVDLQCQDSVLRCLEIVGEAAVRVSAETRTAHPEFPWGEVRINPSVPCLTSAPSAAIIHPN